MIQLLTIFCLLSLGSAWSQPRTCYVKQSSCSGDSDYFRRIAESLESVSISLKQQAVKCSSLPPISNGIISYNPGGGNPYAFGATATYSCNTGFFLEGNRMRTCGGDTPTGVWSGTIPVCSAVTCLPLPALSNGIISYSSNADNSYAFGATATYSCNSGFLLQGNGMRTCGGDTPTGMWSGTSPVCMDTLGTFENPASSCSQISQDRPSGNYWIQPSSGSASLQVYCETTPRNCSCSTSGAWMRVANLDMTDPNQDCPAGLSLKNLTLRVCGKPEGGVGGCVGTGFETHGVEYSHVCGRIKAYQDGAPDSFFPNLFVNQTIDEGYVDGISLTYGQSPRQHIWTFACAIDEVVRLGPNRDWLPPCPCSHELSHPETASRSIVPEFVGNNYFCDTAASDYWQYIFYPDDPLWDGQGCKANSTCCEFNTPPWFCTQLPQPITDRIDLRICGDQGELDEDTPIEQLEIYVY